MNIRLFGVIVFSLFLCGCKSRAVDRLLNIDRRGESPRPQFIAFACCRDNNGGVLTYPDFVPQSHRDNCELARAAAHDDRLIDGNTWIAVNTDCGHGNNYIGDNYYQGKGY